MAIIPGFNEPYPTRDAIVKESRKPADVLVRWEEQSLLQRISQTPYRVQAAEVLPNQSASTFGTLGGDQTAGLYRVTSSLNVKAAEAAASVQLTVAWQYGGLTRTHTFPVLDGSLVDGEQGQTYALQIDPGTPISYTLAYVGATFTYDATLSAELLQVVS